MLVWKIVSADSSSLGECSNLSFDVFFFLAQWVIGNYLKVKHLFARMQWIVDFDVFVVIFFVSSFIIEHFFSFSNMPHFFRSLCWLKLRTYTDALADEIAEDLFLQEHPTDRMSVVPLQFYKRSAYGYSGTRGKKIPWWEMRRKFIGVRGKRLSQTNFADAQNSLDNVHSNNERIAVQTGFTTNSGIIVFKCTWKFFLSFKNTFGFWKPLRA